MKTFDPSLNKMAQRTKSIKIDGYNIFYREAGVGNGPQLVLYHGFPGSSAYYRNLLPLLADKFHVVAPDFLGFGNSDKPNPADHAYTFDNTAEMMAQFQEQLGFTRTGMFLQDYGGPVGFRIIEKHPDWLEWLIVQNTNAFEEGFTEVWNGLRGAYWQNKTPETEEPLRGFLQPGTVKTLYQHGHADPSLVLPEAWQNDIFHLQGKNAERIQLDFFYDYRKNVEQYAAVQAMFKKMQPKTQIFWGDGDIFFTREGGEAYLRILPNADFHWLKSGHFAVEDCGEYIAAEMKRFYADNVQI
jgi:pimeloyl-ACP methyl ester carboxylesterase